MILNISKGRMELSKGVKMLAFIFFTFTFCYTTRSLYDIFFDTSLEFSKAFTGVMLPIMWDFLPISLMFLYHI